MRRSSHYRGGGRMGRRRLRATPGKLAESGIPPSCCLDAGQYVHRAERRGTSLNGSITVWTSTSSGSFSSTRQANRCRDCRPKSAQEASTRRSGLLDTFGPPKRRGAATKGADGKVSSTQCRMPLGRIQRGRTCVRSGTGSWSRRSFRGACESAG